MLYYLTTSIPLSCQCNLVNQVKDLFQHLSDTLSKQVFDPTVLVLFSTVLAGFISVTVPVALSIVSSHTKDYKDKEISESFLHEPTYRYQIIALPIIVVCAILTFGMKINHGWLVYLMITLNIISFIVFVWFLNIFGQYATNFDTYYSDKLKHEANEIIQGK